MSTISRRTFLKRSLAAGTTGGLLMAGTGKIARAATQRAEPLATVIDLTKCDGCPGAALPECLSA